MYNSSRYWYSVWGAPKFACGWCFGDTPAQALEAALSDVNRWHPELRGRSVRITLKRDTSPAEYFDFPPVVP